MRYGNPNTPNQPYAPQYPQMSRQQQGGRNPYGYGMERIAGATALQRNVPGMATNTSPLPRTRQPQPSLQNWMQQGMQRFQQQMQQRQPAAQAPYRPNYRQTLGIY